MALMRLLLLGSVFMAVMVSAEVNMLDKEESLQMPEERYKDAPKGSLAGEADPGYGAASASRTDMQRIHEASEKARNEAINEHLEKGTRVPSQLYDPLEPATQKEAKVTHRDIWRRVRREAHMTIRASTKAGVQRNSVDEIKAQARRVAQKLVSAKRLVRAQFRKERRAAAKAARRKDKESAESKKKKEFDQAVEAEVQKLEIADSKDALPDNDDSGVNAGEEVMVHASGNWVHDNKQPNGRRFRAKKGQTRVAKHFVEK
jgi:valyl-tRNA synthetase